MLPREMGITEFKATCLAVIEEVHRTQQTLIITKRGKAVAEVGPVTRAAEASRVLGGLRGALRITGDIERPAADPDEWDAMR